MQKLLGLLAAQDDAWLSSFVLEITGDTLIVKDYMGEWDVVVSFDEDYHVSIRALPQGRSYTAINIGFAAFSNAQEFREIINSVRAHYRWWYAKDKHDRELVSLINEYVEIGAKIERTKELLEEAKEELCKMRVTLWS